MDIDSYVEMFRQLHPEVAKFSKLDLESQVTFLVGCLREFKYQHPKEFDEMLIELPNTFD